MDTVNNTSDPDQGQPPTGSEKDISSIDFEGVSGERILQIGAMSIKTIRALLAAGELKEIANRVSNEELETAEKYLEQWAIYAGVADTEQEFLELLAYFLKIKP